MLPMSSISRLTAKKSTKTGLSAEVPWGMRLLLTSDDHEAHAKHVCLSITEARGAPAVEEQS